MNFIQEIKISVTCLGECSRWPDTYTQICKGKFILEEFERQMKLVFVTKTSLFYHCCVCIMYLHLLDYKVLSTNLHHYNQIGSLSLGLDLYLYLSLFVSRSVWNVYYNFVIIRIVYCNFKLDNYMTKYIKYIT